MSLIQSIGILGLNPKMHKILGFLVLRNLPKSVEYASDKYPSLYQLRGVVFTCEDLVAFLKYKGQQTKHCDSRHLMDLDDPQKGNSSLFMVNADVNCEIEYDSAANKYVTNHNNSKKHKYFCFHQLGNECTYKTHLNDKHLPIKKGTIVIATPPDVAWTSHMSAGIDGWTMVCTIRGLSEAVKSRLQKVSAFISSFRNYLENE